MDISRRTAGLGLAGYGIVTLAAVANSGPGGDYSRSDAARFVSGGHQWLAFGIGYAGCFAALGLLLFALGTADRVGSAASVYRGLGIAGTGIGITGFFLSAGIAVAFAEGGPPVRTGVGLPVVYVLSEVANLVAACAPAFCLGLMGWLLVLRGAVPTWLRAVTAVGATSGMLAAFFFPLPLYLLWMLVLGGWTARSGSVRRAEVRQRMAAGV